MPDPTVPTPPTDPRLAALSARARSLRVDLDRLDAQVDDLDPDDRADLHPRAVALREAVDQFDADLEQRAAGLAAVQHRPGCPVPDLPAHLRAPGEPCACERDAGQ